MTKAPVRHRLHEIADRLGRRAGGHLSRHHLSERLFECVCAMLRQRPNNIALGKNAGYPAIRAKDDNRANSMLRQRIYRGFERRGGLHRNDCVTLGGQDALYHRHGSPPLPVPAAASVELTTKLAAPSSSWRESLPASRINVA